MPIILQNATSLKSCIIMVLSKSYKWQESDCSNRTVTVRINMTKNMQLLNSQILEWIIWKHNGKHFMENILWKRVLPIMNMKIILVWYSMWTFEKWKIWIWIELDEVHTLPRRILLSHERQNHENQIIGCQLKHVY